MSPTSIVAYLVLFAAVGFLAIFVALVLGRLLRPRAPSPEKLEIYECGEPTIGPGFVQFDLRFYVVALLFIVFDVEVAFFFPWAVVFGKATHLLDPRAKNVVPVEAAAGDVGPKFSLSPDAAQNLRDLGVQEPALPAVAGGAEAKSQPIEHSARQLAVTALADMGVFFGVLLVGFAYLWRRGDLDWVRALSRRPAEAAPEEAEPLAVGTSIE